MKLKNTKVYKIQHLPSGSFKMGGQSPRFSKLGKMWIGGRVKNHLRMFDYDTRGKVPFIDKLINCWLNGSNRIDPHDCDVIEYELVETGRQPLVDFIREEMD